MSSSFGTRFDPKRDIAIMPTGIYGLAERMDWHARRPRWLWRAILRFYDKRYGVGVTCCRPAPTPRRRK